MYIYFQIDKELASGEYFLNKDQKRAKKQKERDNRQAEAAKKREEKRNEAFIPPNEPSSSKGIKSSNMVDVSALKEKILKARKNTKIFNKSVKGNIAREK